MREFAATPKGDEDQEMYVVRWSTGVAETEGAATSMICSRGRMPLYERKAARRPVPRRPVAAAA